MAKITGPDLPQLAAIIRRLADDVEAGRLGDSPSILQYAHCADVMTLATGNMITDKRLVATTVVISSFPSLATIELALKQIDRELPVQMS